MATKKIQTKLPVEDPKPYYNVVVEMRNGDKYLKVQTTVPTEYVDMEYPSAHRTSELDFDDMVWQVMDNDILLFTIYAIEVRPLTLNTLLSEHDFNKMRRV